MLIELLLLGFLLLASLAGVSWSQARVDQISVKSGS
jgi:hypothetical protein